MNRINEAVGDSPLPRFRNRPAELISTPAKELLNLRRLPAMLNGQQAAVLLGVGEHDIPALIRADLLKPLGQPPANSVKYFAGVEILEMAGDPAYLAKIRNALYAYWQGKNGTHREKPISRNGGGRHA